MSQEVISAYAQRHCYVIVTLAISSEMLHSQNRRWY